MTNSLQQCQRTEGRNKEAN